MRYSGVVAIAASCVVPAVSVAQQRALMSSEIMLISPFNYVPAAGSGSQASGANSTSATEVDPNLPKRSPSQQRIADFYTAGDYQSAGTEGMALLAKEKPDDGLQLTIANSLAWTGRLKEAVPAYMGITQGEYANDAYVGLANILRWTGRDHQAAPIYQDVLANDPDNVAALQGLELANREMSPRTMFTLGGNQDSFDSRRRYGTLNHRWRTDDGSGIMELETSSIRDSIPTFEADQRDLTARYQALDLELKPSLELSLPSNTGNSIYGSGRIHFDEDRGTLEVGRVNWGRLAMNPNALAANLSATHIGGSEKREFNFGTVSGRVNYFDISDGNTLLTAGIHLASKWRPLGKNWKPFAGAETRSSKFAAPNYWSPSNGSGVAYGGLLGEWSSEDWMFYTSGQVGFGFYGDAGTSWSATGGGKTWLTRDIALGVNLWAMSSWRDAAQYRAQSANVSLEKLWR
jgi:tetratricopeptide (TPR) repeat protein